MKPLLFIIVFLSVLLSSCIQIQQDNKLNIEREKQAFIYFRKIFKADTSKVTIEADRAMGAGICVQSDVYNKFRTILSVAHICEEKQLTHDEISEEFDLKDEDLDSLTYEYESEGTNYSGRIDKLIILKIDKENDLCLLAFKEKNAKCSSSVSISETLPAQGQRLYSMQMPLSSHMQNNALVFDGRYSGLNNSKQELLFTIPATFGSSGSPIFNERGQLISVITKTIVKFNQISVGVHLDKIRRFVNTKEDK